MTPRPLNLFERISTRGMTTDEQQAVWNAIEQKLNQAPVVEQQRSSTNILTLLRMPFAPLILALVLIFGGSAATVAAADNAKPGDILFPLDTAIERLQLSLKTSDASKTKFQLKIAGERLHEAEELITQLSTSNQVNVNTNANSATSTATTTPPTTSTSTPTSTATTTPPTTSTSTPTSTATTTPGFKPSPRAAQALDMAIATLTKVKAQLEAKGNTQAAAKIQITIDKLKQMNASTLTNGSIKIENEGRKQELKIKLKGIGEELKLQAKFIGTFTTSTATSSRNINTNVKIKIDDDDDDRATSTNQNLNQNRNSRDDDEDEDDDRDNKRNKNKSKNLTINRNLNTNSNANTNRNVNSNLNTNSNSQAVLLKKVKAELEDGEAKIEVELGNNTYKFTLQTTDSNQIIDEVMKRYGVVRSDVERVFILEN